MATVLRPAKAKAAERVIEVLDFFDEQNRHATVMDIVRRYNRPQSSTSELLASLVDLGLLYKDSGSRSYSLTPRAAILGSLSQPRLVRDGRLATLIDTLRGKTGLGALLIGMVGPNAQIFRFKPGMQRLDGSSARSLAGGTQSSLCGTAAGWLLLSTMPTARREGIIRRLNAEAADDRKFSQARMSAHIQDCGRLGYAVGPAGFGIAADMVSVLLPAERDDRPMALGLVYQPGDHIDADALLATIQSAVEGCAVRFDGAEAEGLMADAA